MHVAVVTQIAALIAAVEHVALVDTQAEPPPQRRGHVVTSRCQELACVGQPLTLALEQQAHLFLGGRHPGHAVVGAGRAVELVYHLFDDVPGEGVDVALMPDREEVEELAERDGLTRPWRAPGRGPE